MTGTNHGMTGAVIALTVKEPLIAVPASFASHFVCDAIPHFGVSEKELFQTKFNIILVTDFLVAVTIMVALGFWFPGQRWLIWACMIAAASPDLMWAYYRLYVEHIKKRKFHLDPLARFHHVIQWSSTTPGALVEIAWFVLMGTILVTIRA
jgi:hypothetical protein